MFASMQNLVLDKFFYEYIANAGRNFAELDTKIQTYLAEI